MKIIKIKENDVNIRIDKFIRKIYPNFSLGYIYKLFRTNKIKINDKKIKINYLLQLNDVISIYLDENSLNSIPTTPASFLSAKSAIDVVYEDENLIVVNKPKKLLVYDEKDEKFDTLINRVKKYLFNQKKWNPDLENQFEPSLLHRLDFNTSGLVMIAKNNKTLVSLNNQIKSRNIDKYYLCYVHGKLNKNQDTLNAFWKKDNDKNIVSIIGSFKTGYEPIITKYRVLSYDAKNDISKLEVLLVTGKTHQIRAHMAFIGHPILGEVKYTNQSVNKSFDFDSQQLVAYKIVFNIKNDEFLEYLNSKEISLK